MKRENFTKKNALAKMTMAVLIGAGAMQFATAQTFTPGNIAVIVAASNTANNTTSSIVELNTTTAGQSAVNTYTVDGTVLRFSGSATSTMYLANTNDGTLISFNGGATSSTSGNINTVIPRGIGTFNNVGTFSVATTYSGTSGNQTRGSSSLNNTTWYIGDQGGVYSNGTTSASPTGNIRPVKAFGGNVYVASASATATVTQVSTLSAPTAGTITGLPGLTNNASLQDFYMISSGANGSTYDILYVLSATSNTVGSITKYSLVSGTWTSNGSYTTTFGGFGIAAAVGGNGAYIYVSEGLGALAANRVIKVTDAAGYNAAINITTANNLTLYTTAAGTTIKGVAFAPCSVAPTSVSAASNSAICAGNSLNLTASATGAVSYSWSGPNGFSSTMQNPSIANATTAATGTYTLTAINACGTTTATAAVTVNALPSIYNVTGGGSACQGSAGVAVGLDNSTSGVNYQLMNGASTAGAAVAGTGTVIAFANQTTAGTYTVVATDATSGCSSNMNGNAVVSITATVIPSISVNVSPSNTICSGTNVTFSATPTNGGTTPIYQWMLNGANVGTNQDNYSNISLADGDVVVCTFTSNATCVVPTTATSNSITIFVTTSVVPSVTLSAVSGTSNCNGATVTFTAMPTNGGATPVYQWAVNGNTVVGLTSDTYTTNTLNDQDVVSCMMTSSNGCALPSTATANSLTMTVIPTVTPSVSISANPAGAICAGISVTFTATPTNGGTPVYQWTKNGNTVGSNSNIYTDAALANNDVIVCTLTSNAVCATSTTATATVTETVNANPTPSITGTLTFCTPNSTTLDAGAGYASYLWSNGATTQTISVTAGGTYSVMVSDGTCNGSSATVTVTALSTPAQPGAFTAGQSSVVVGQTGVVYTVPNDPTVTYTWTYSGTGATINGTGNSVSIDFSSGATGGTLSVTATNNCGTSAATTMAITTALQPVFGTGNLVLLQTSGGPSKSSSAITLKEITTNGTPGMTVNVPAGEPTPFQTAGVFGGSEGFLTTSTDQKYLVLTGYATSATFADITGTPAASTPRAVGVVYPSGYFQQMYSSTTNYDGNDIRGAVSDGTNFWASGASGANIDGIDYYGPGAPVGLGTGPVPPKAYAIRIFNGQLYYSTQKAGPSNSTAQLGIFSLGSGLPTSGTPTPMQLINTGSTVVEDFSINPTTDVCYVAVNLNTAVGGIQKWTKSGSTWSLAYTLGTGITNTGAYGLVVDYSGANPIIYATTFDAGGNRVIKIVDTGASSTAATIVSSAAGVYYKGITFAPVAIGTPVVNLTVSQDTASEALATSVVVTANASAPVSGTQTVALTVTGTNITTGDYVLTNTVITIPSGSASGSVTFTVVDDALPEAYIETAVLTIANPSSGIVLGSMATQNIDITDNDGNTPPTIVMDVANTTDYIDGAAATSPASPYTVSGTMTDPTDPASTFGINFTINDQQTAVGSLTVSVASSNTVVVPSANVTYTVNGASVNVKIVPADIGYSNISVSVTDGVNTTSYVIYYASSDPSPVLSAPNTFWHTGLSDASDAIAIDDNYYMTGDDELDYINVYSRNQSGLPVVSFDATNLLNLPDPSKPEVDIEAAAESPKNTGRSYWLGSMSNTKAPYNTAPNRDRLFATHHTGTGAATVITIAGYSAIKSALVAWGDSYGYNFSASSAAGVDSKGVNGFSAEGMVFGPDSTTLWIGLRAPLVPTATRTNAVLAPILNFEAWFNNGNQTGAPTFGPPIELDLNLNGIRDIIRLSNGTYIIIAGSPLDNAGSNELYKWTGNPADAPVHVTSAGGGNLNMEGAMEVHTAGNLNLTKIQVISDYGANVLYNDANEAKDFTDLNLRKFRSDVLTGIDLDICTGFAVNINSNHGTAFCAGDSATLTASASTSTYSWSTTDTASHIIVKNAGSYSVTATNTHSGCKATTSTNITVNTPVASTVTVNGQVLTASTASSYQWYYNGSIISGATSQTYTATQNGTYEVMTSDANTCTAMSNTVSVTNIGIDRLQNNLGGAVVKPNPFENYFELDLSTETGNYTIELYNAIGERVATLFNGELTTGNTHFTFNSLPELKNGIYFLKIQTGSAYQLLKICQTK